MSNDIGVGDLVYVAHPLPCCGDNTLTGFTFVVRKLGRHLSVCRFCGEIVEADFADHGKGGGFLLTCLKKINPPAVKQDTTTDKQLPETV